MKQWGYSQEQEPNAEVDTYRNKTAENLSNLVYGFNNIQLSSFGDSVLAVASDFCSLANRSGS